MNQMQRKGVFVTAKNQRKGGFINLREIQPQTLGKTDLDLNELDELSETNSTGFEIPASLLKRRVIYENTYKMKPDQRFPVAQIEKIIHEVLEESLQHENYDVKKSRDLIKNVSQTIKDKVKEMDIPRYKLVVMVHIGENKGQDIKIASRCLWNDVYDSYATASLQNSSILAQASVFGVFFE